MANKVQSKNRLVFEPEAGGVQEVRLAAGADSSEIPTQDELNELVALVLELDGLTAEQERLAERQKTISKEIDRLAVNSIPTLLANSPNITQIRFKDGRSLSLKDELFCRITEQTVFRRDSRRPH